MFVVVMGVSGSGKSTVGRALAQRLGCPFYDADDFHPPANIARMAAGVPLDDADRAGWLAALAGLIRASLERGEGGVLACSALKESYRQALLAGAAEPGLVRFVWLKGDYPTILARIQRRAGHYMKAGMLQSQFDALEEPVAAIAVDIALPPEAVVQQVLKLLDAQSDVQR